MDTFHEVYEWLVRTAQAERVITITEITGQLGLHGKNEPYRELDGVLTDISCSENAQGHPLLSAVVVLPGIGYPGMGFFLLARELGVNTCCDERSFFYHELKRVHEFWRYPPLKKRVNDLPHELFRPAKVSILSYE